jgi:hypothetical protein
MGITETELKNQANKAFEEIIDDWQEEAARAINNAKMEKISHTPEIFKSAVWINMGLGAATNLAPLHTGIKLES